MADCLISLSKSGESQHRGRLFVCKTCNREFSSFQALGGHRASHRKPRFSAGDLLQTVSSIKPKSHECSICGIEFPIGQALGGHMRRHRNAASSEELKNREEKSQSAMECEGDLVGLDLNLTPLENDLIRLRLLAPAVRCLT